MHIPAERSARCQEAGGGQKNGSKRLRQVEMPLTHHPGCPLLSLCHVTVPMRLFLQPYCSKSSRGVGVGRKGAPVKSFPLASMLEVHNLSR